MPVKIASVIGPEERRGDIFQAKNKHATLSAAIYSAESRNKAARLEIRTNVGDLFDLIRRVELKEAERVGRGLGGRSRTRERERETVEPVKHEKERRRLRKRRSKELKEVTLEKHRRSRIVSRITRGYVSS